MLMRKNEVHLSLNVTDELNDELVALAKETGGTKSDVLRKAVGLFRVAVEAKKRGLKFGSAEKTAQMVTEVVAV